MLSDELKEEAEFFANLWSNGTKEDRQSMSYIPLTFTKEQFDYFGSKLTRMWCIHYFEGGFE